jgi:hypothetical protein
MEAWKQFIPIGILLVFLSLCVAVYMTNCVTPLIQGFSTSEVKIPKVGPEPKGLVDMKELVADGELPMAPNSYLAEDAPLPFQDPKTQKASKRQVDGLLEEMKAFNGFELPYLTERGDPNIQMPVSTFRGQLQELLDESNAMNQNPGLASTITLEQLEAIRGNLRYLQKTFRQLNANGVIDAPERPSGKGGVKEGFTDGTGERATASDLEKVSRELSNEIKRLSASGSTDSVLLSRITLFTQLRQKIDSILVDVGNGTMSTTEIPIFKEDLVNFLPALSEGDTGDDLSEYSDGIIGGIKDALKALLGGSTVADGSGSLVNLVGRAQADRLAQKILNGLSVDFKVKYTSDNELALARTQADVINTLSATMALGSSDQGTDPTTQEGYQGGGFYDRGTTDRGEFDAVIQTLDSQQGIRPKAKPLNVGGLDWKDRALNICENIRKAGLDPADYGCLKSSQDVGPSYSWRGHARMVCTRLESNAMPGTAETMGCPPVSWKGWRS